MKSFGERCFWIILVFSVLMVNPPVVYWVNDYCLTHPLTFGWPTMYLWLEFWYIVIIVAFLFSAWKLKAWDCRQDQTKIEQIGHSE